MSSGWFTSRHSGNGNDQCVEVCLDPVEGPGTDRTAGVMARVRDSKDRTGGVLWLGMRAWTALLDAAP